MKTKSYYLAVEGEKSQRDYISKRIFEKLIEDEDLKPKVILINGYNGLSENSSVQRVRTEITNFQRAKDIDPLTLATCNAAANIQIIKGVILPNLKQGNIVISNGGILTSITELLNHPYNIDQLDLEDINKLYLNFYSQITNRDTILVGSKSFNYTGRLNDIIGAEFIQETSKDVQKIVQVGYQMVKSSVKGEK